MSVKIILTGYMACGKSATAKILAKKLNLNCIDLDKWIEEHENLSIENIFKNYGEIHFRKLEIKYLKQIIECQNNYVLSLGGGTPCFGENYKFLQLTDIQSFYLKTSVQEINKRLQNSSQVRPLLQNIPQEKWEDFITKHIFERSFYYNFAKTTINTNFKNNETVADEVLKLLHIVKK